MTKKMIEKYVIFDMDGNVVGNIEDITSPVNTLRIYDREKSSTIIKVDSGDAYLNLYAAKACIAACDDYIPLENEDGVLDD